VARAVAEAVGPVVAVLVATELPRFLRLYLTVCTQLPWARGARVEVAEAILFPLVVTIPQSAKLLLQVAVVLVVFPLSTERSKMAVLAVLAAVD
jgi:hypothetical protein